MEFFPGKDMDQNPLYRNPEINWIVRVFPGPVRILQCTPCFGKIIKYSGKGLQKTLSFETDDFAQPHWIYDSSQS